MATVTGLTSARMQEIADASVVSGSVNEMGSLILTTHGGSSIDAGAVMDPLLPGTSGQYYRGDKSWQTLDKAAAGLGNVDNTSDASKPVSTAQAAADNLLAKGLTAQVNGTGAVSGIASTWTLLDLLAVNLIAGRWYRVEYKFNSNSAGQANLAFAVELRKSVTTDTTTAGTALADSFTEYTAPVAGQGSTSLISFVWKASDTETVNLKINSVRAVGTATYSMDARRMMLFDSGAQF